MRYQAHKGTDGLWRVIDTQQPHRPPLRGGPNNPITYDQARSHAAQANRGKVVTGRPRSGETMESCTLSLAPRHITWLEAQGSGNKSQAARNLIDREIGAGR